MANVGYQIRLCKICVAPQFSTGRKLPACEFSNGPLTGGLLGGLSLFILYPSVTNWIRQYLNPGKSHSPGGATFKSIADKLVRRFIPDPSASYQNSSASTLRKMAQRALEIQDEAPHDPSFPAAARIPSSFTTALDTVRTLAFHTNKQS